MRLPVLYLVGLMGLISPSLAGRQPVLKKWKSVHMSSSSAAANGQHPHLSSQPPAGADSSSRELAATTNSSDGYEGESLKTMDVPTFSYDAAGRTSNAEKKEEEQGSSHSFLGNDAIIAIAASAGAIVLLGGALYGLRSYMFQEREGEGGVGTNTMRNKGRPGGLDTTTRDLHMEAGQKEPTSGRLQDERSKKSKILVPQDSKVDSTRSTNDNRGDFFTLTDIDLVSPGKGKYTSPRV